jgi:type II secretory pathway component PulC
MNLPSNLHFNKQKLVVAACIVGGLAAAKVVSTGMLFFTSGEPLLQSSIEKTNVFENYKLSSKFALANKLTATATTQNWKLRGIFKHSVGSFIIFEDSSKTVFLSLGESYNGYKLDEISIDKAKFSNGGAVFELKLDKKDSATAAATPTESSSSNFRISRVKFEKYAKNMGLLADEVQVEQTNNGILIKSIAKDSFFSDLGLKENDLIVEANGNRVNSFSDIMGIFKDPEHTKFLNIIIKRQNLKKELGYEIN